MSGEHSVVIPPSGFGAVAPTLPSPAQSEGGDGGSGFKSMNFQADQHLRDGASTDRPKSPHAVSDVDMLLHFQASAITPPESPDDEAPNMEWSPSREEEGSSGASASGNEDGDVLPSQATYRLTEVAHTAYKRNATWVDDAKDHDHQSHQNANLALNFSLSNKRQSPTSFLTDPAANKKPRKNKPVRSLPPEYSMKARQSVGSEGGSLGSPSFNGFGSLGRQSANVGRGQWSTSSQASSDDSLGSLPAPAVMARYRDHQRRFSDASSQPFEVGSDRRSASPERSEDSFPAGRRVPIVASLSLQTKPDGSHLFLPTGPSGLVTTYVDPDSDSDRDEFFEELRVKMSQTFTFAAVDEMILKGERSRLLYWNDEAVRRQPEAEKAAHAHTGSYYEERPASPVRRSRAESAPAGTSVAPTRAKPKAKRAPVPSARTTTKVFRSDNASIEGFPPLPSTPKVSREREPQPIQTPRVSYDIENVEIKRIRKSEPHETAGAPVYTWNKGDPIKYGPEDEYFDVLTKDEVKLCETIRLAPKLYLFVKDTMLSYKEEHGYFKKLEAKKWFRLDVNKTGKVYDWSV